jgi:hypothetical protein
VPDGFALNFADAQWAVTPGQSAVLYDGEVCLGGGVMTRCTQCYQRYQHCQSAFNVVEAPSAPERPTLEFWIRRNT